MIGTPAIGYIIPVLYVSYPFTLKIYYNDVSMLLIPGIYKSTTY